MADPFHISPATFVVLLREVTEELGIDIRRIDDDSAELTYRDDHVHVNFGNVRPQLNLAGSADEARAILKEFVSSVTSVHHLDDRRLTDFEVVRDKLMPRVRVGQPSQPETMPEELPAHHLVGDLQINLVGDEPNLVWYVTDQHLQGWGVDFYEALAVATRNLRDKTQPEMLNTVDDLPHFFVCEAGDSYDAARVLILKDMLDPWPESGIVVCTPARDALLVTALHDPEALRSMHVMIGFGHELYGKDYYAISDQPMWYDGQQWEMLPVKYGDDVLELHPGERFVEVLNHWGTADGAGGQDVPDDSTN